jgi:hypothetical protein
MTARSIDAIAESCRKAMRGFDTLSPEMRAALNDEPATVSEARQLSKRLGCSEASSRIARRSIDRLAMQRALLRPVIVVSSQPVQGN